MSTTQQTFDRSRQNISMTFAHLYADMASKEATLKAHEDFNCVGECPHCGNEGVRTHHSNDGKIYWRVSSDIKAFVFEVFQESISTYCELSVHECYVGSWLTRAEAMPRCVRIEYHDGNTFTGGAVVYYDRDTGNAVKVGGRDWGVLAIQHR